MFLAPILFLALSSASMTAQVSVPVQLPISSRAELDAYMRDTPMAKSPLRFLSPEGRKRFIAELQFGSKGLASTPLDDAMHELTHAQAVQLFELFGVAYVAQGLGLTPAEAAVRRKERIHSAHVRGCAKVAPCPPSPMEQHYNELVLNRPPLTMLAAQRGASIVRRYNALFGAYQTPDRLLSMSAQDLRLLKRATETAVFWEPSERHLAQLKQDLAEMQRRGMVTDGGFVSLYRGLVAARRFDDAASLASRHVDLDVPSLPTWQAPARDPSGRPSALSISADGASMTRQGFTMDDSLRIVVVASCHFSKDAARAIQAVPQLQRIFVQHAIWLADQGESIAAAEAWNREFPSQPIHIAWSNREWPMLDNWAMPTFYIFRKGKLVDKWSGWPADTGLQTLQRHLKKDGVL